LSDYAQRIEAVNREAEKMQTDPFIKREAAQSRNEALMRAFEEATTENPFCRRERVWELRAAFEIEIFDGSIHLGCIRPFERGNGDGRKALNWFCQLAKEHQVSVRGTIKPCGNTRPRLNAKQLRDWYKRHGFTVKNGNIWLSA
jgi:hypothetical protein